MRSLSLCLILTLCLLRCDDSTSPADAPATACGPAHTATTSWQTLAAQLECLWEDQDTTGLLQWCDTWSAVVPPHTTGNSQLISPLLRELYEIYAAFYTPHDLSALGFEYGAGFYADIAYAFVQPDVRYAVVTDIGYDGSRYEPAIHDSTLVDSGTIDDFRPPLPTLPMDVAYLDNAHAMALDSFLLADKAPADSTLPGAPFDEGPTTADRAAFLSTVTKLMHEHWTIGYIIETGPVAYRI
ncbi:MAG: hypothetical protein GF331_21815, partial [Chitinivibrionales bacterium]|nr:hypothetical protein [Chitinivibrionales bacterium]